MSKHGIIKGSKGAAFAEAVREKMVTLELGDEELTAKRAREVRESAYEHATQIEQLVMAQIALAQKEPAQILRVASALKGLSLAAGTLERLHSLKYRAMGLDKHVDERELPKLIIDCFTDAEIADITQQGDNEDLVGAELVDEPSGADLGLEPRSRPEDDDVVALGFDDNDVEEEPTPAAVAVVRVDDEGCRLVRDASQSA